MGALARWYAGRVGKGEQSQGSAGEELNRLGVTEVAERGFVRRFGIVDSKRTLWFRNFRSGKTREGPHETGRADNVKRRH